jgi:erythronate-4-phosphate dehydrogenase
MRIVIDKNLPFGAEAFSTVGDVLQVQTNAMSADAVHDADALIIRSETKVTPDLLKGSAIKFVGTATIGTDHIDIAWLKTQGIGFANAPGCNANSVVEYIAAALFSLGAKKGFSLRGKTLGIVGAGTIGSKVETMAQALGMKVLLNDPPLKRMSGDSRYLPLGDLMGADIITLHVPLNKSGSDPTYHLFDAARLSSMKKGTLLMNAARGAVVETSALISALRSGHLGGAVLDVWEGEPNISDNLNTLVTLGTPHIAGYSLDGKVKAVHIVYDAMCRFFNVDPIWQIPAARMPAPEIRTIALTETNVSAESLLGNAVKQCYDIERDDHALRSVMSHAAQERPSLFMRLRTGYRVRREFSATEVTTADPALGRLFSMLGFSSATKV